MNRWKQKGEKNIYHANTSQKKAGIAINFRQDYQKV